MTFDKLDSNSIKITTEQVVFRADLLSEKETLEKRLAELDLMLKSLD